MLYTMDLLRNLVFLSFLFYLIFFFFLKLPIFVKIVPVNWHLDLNNSSAKIKLSCIVSIGEHMVSLSTTGI